MDLNLSFDQAFKLIADYLGQNKKEDSDCYPL